MFWDVTRIKNFFHESKVSNSKMTIMTITTLATTVFKLFLCKRRLIKGRFPVFHFSTKNGNAILAVFLSKRRMYRHASFPPTVGCSHWRRHAVASSAAVNYRFLFLCACAISCY